MLPAPSPKKETTSRRTLTGQWKGSDGLGGILEVGTLHFDNLFTSYLP